VKFYSAKSFIRPPEVLIIRVSKIVSNCNQKFKDFSFKV
jgi:hypothetical protein